MEGRRSYPARAGIAALPGTGRSVCRRRAAPGRRPWHGGPDVESCTGIFPCGTLAAGPSSWFAYRRHPNPVPPTIAGSASNVRRQPRNPGLSTHRDRASRRVPGLPARGRLRVDRGRARRGRADPGPRRLRRAMGHGRPDGRLGGRRVSVAFARARRDPGGGRRTEDAVLRLLPRPPASRAGARRRGRAGGRARDRHHGGGADGGGPGEPDLRRPAGGPLLPPVAWRGGVAGAARRADPRRVPGLRGAGTRLRRPCLQHPVPHRDHRRHGAPMGRSSRLRAGPGEGDGEGRAGRVRGRGGRPHGRSQP